MFRKLIKLLFIIYFLFLPFFVFAQNTIDLYIFRGEGCPHCAEAMKFLIDLQKKYPALTIKDYEIFYHTENLSLYYALGTAYKQNLTNAPVPIIYINDKSFVGFNNYTGDQIKKEVARCSSAQCISPLEKITVKNQKISLNYRNIFIFLAIIVLPLIAIFLYLKRKNGVDKDWG